MSFLRILVSIVMVIVLPISNLFASWKKPKQGEFTELEPVTKTERKYDDYTPSKNDILVSADGIKNISLEKALNEIKQRRNSGNTGKICVWMTEGTYNLDEKIIIDSSIYNVEFKACPNEKVSITAVKEFTNWTLEKINGVDVWSTDTDGADFKALYKDYKTLPVSRYPENGYLTVKSPGVEDQLYTAENAPWQLTRGDVSIYTNGDIDVDSFYNEKNIQVKILHYWFGENILLDRYSKQEGKVYLQKPCTMIVEEGQRYFFENVREGLNSAGEWYLDSLKNKLYYVPQSGDDINSTVIYAPTMQTIIDINGSKDVTFKNIEFKNTGWNFSKPDSSLWLGGFGLLFPQGNLECEGAIEVTKSAGITFKNCDFVNIGATAIRFNKLVKNISVTGCKFNNIGCNAVFVDGYNEENKDRITENVTVCDNNISEYGRTFPSGIGVLVTHARNCNVSNNEIHDGYYTAISVGWMWGYSFSVTDYNTISNNLIYDIGQGWLSDMGGIYTLGMQPHTKITYNHIHNVAADSGQGGYGGWGIYLDEGSSEILVEKNLVYDCGSQSFHQHYGRDNLIRNNIFAFSKEGQLRVTRNEEHNELTLKGNILVGENSPVYVSTQKGKFVDDNNLYWDYKNGKHVYGIINEKYYWEDRIFKPVLKLMGYANDAVMVDPMFRDAKNFDFLIADNSPALSKIGFEPWNYNTAGTLSKY